jgi:uncharacterized Tic20 family protein
VVGRGQDNRRWNGVGYREIAASFASCGAWLSGDVVAYFYDPESPPEPARLDDERRWAAIAHLSVIVPIVGPLAVYWKTRREQPWASRQALQALAYAMAVIVLEAGVFLVSLVLGAILAVASGSPPGLSGPVLCALPALLALGALGLAGYAALQCYLGRTFRYPVVGELIDGL